MSDEPHKFPSQLAERFQIRMPDGLRDRIRKSAEANGRSMNTEIVAALEEKFPEEDPTHEFMRLLRAMSPEDREKALKLLRGAAKY